MKKFEIGLRYAGYLIVRRNEKSVWIETERGVIRRAIYEYSDGEVFMPKGNNKGAPTVRASFRA